MNSQDLRNSLIGLIYDQYDDKFSKNIKAQLIEIALDKNLKYLLNIDGAKKIRGLINENVSFTELANVIRDDELLTSSIIKTSNSPLYPKLKPVNELSRAMVTIGVGEIRKLLSMPGYASIVKGNSKLRIIRHVIFNSIFSAWMAEDAINVLKGNKIFGDFSNDEIFNFAILHNIGKLILTYKNKELILNHSESENVDFLQARLGEKDVFGITHDLYGAIIGNQFNFSDELIYVIALHHYIYHNFENSSSSSSLDIHDKIISLYCEYYRNTGKEGTFFSLTMLSAVFNFFDNLSYDIYEYLAMFHNNADYHIFYSKEMNRTDLDTLWTTAVVPGIINNERIQSHTYRLLSDKLEEIKNNYNIEFNSSFEFDSFLTDVPLINEKVLNKIFTSVVGSVRE